MIKQKKTKLIFLILSLFFPLCSSNATVFISENWDTGEPIANWPCGSRPVSCDNATLFNGWHGPGYCCDCPVSASGLSTEKFHSGTRSFKQTRPAGEFNVCDLWHALDTTPSKIYMRWYIYLPTPWGENFNSPDLRPELVHWIFTNTAVANTGFRLNIETLCGAWNTDGIPGYACWSGIERRMHLRAENNGTSAPNLTCANDCYNFLNHINEWICMEIMADATNNLFSLWIDGVQKVNNAINPFPFPTFTNIIISGFNNGYLGADDWVGDFYIDDIVVADEYIGPLGGPYIESLLSTGVFFYRSPSFYSGKKPCLQPACRLHQWPIRRPEAICSITWA